MRWSTAGSTRSIRSFEIVTKTKPEKTLVRKLVTSGWRNNHWHITIRHRWWWHKRAYRLIDFKRLDLLWVESVVHSIEYDPNRSSFIALLFYKNWEKRYIIAPKDLKVWDPLICDEKTPLNIWNRLKLKNIPVSYSLHDLELVPWKWWQIVKSAGTSAKLMSLDWDMAQVSLPSWEVRLISKEAYATVWIVSNTEHNLIRLWKAWRSRWLWRRPQVLGKSMNPVDHPHWWWEWHSPIWLIRPKTPWWMPAIWFKTRNRKKWTNKWISVSRHRNKKK